MSTKAILSLLLALALLAGCQAPASAPAAASLKIGLLPIVDSLPMYVAEQEGFFAAQKVNVELVPFSSAVERDSAVQAGQVDGFLNDLVATLLLDKGSGKLRVVRQTFQGSPAKPMMYLLAAPHSNVKTAGDLPGVDVGVSSNSVIEYTTQMLAQKAGLPPLRTIEVSKIPVRFDMLMQGQLQAATLPDPLASLAITQGARLILDDSKTGDGQSVLTFRQETLAAKPAAVKAFLVAYEQAVKTIAAAPDKYRALLVERAKVPEQIKDTYSIPPYPPAHLPSEAEFASVVQWMVGKGLLAGPVAYGQLVSAEYLPPPAGND
ncbi:MAG: MetQ/NlpA family ABC transporter substrate-binding protein [Chloroflexi bacterium]|nr:MetQ/NlpA family ABC transporter substrate-binding protein [Chloroflexota bacterium]